MQNNGKTAAEQIAAFQVSGSSVGASAEVKGSRTTEQYGAYQRMCDFLNQTLFGGTLPQVILNFSRKTKALGFFAPDRWSKGGEKAHEISLNPEYLAVRTAEQTASTLAHELVHLWQQVHGKPTRNGYHNREWAEKMDEIGLCPSSTGAPGGKRTGQKCSHFIVPDGAFSEAFKSIPEDCLLPWACDAELKAEKKPSGRFKYTCEGCGAKAWGKEGLSLRCMECEMDLGAEAVGEPPAKVELKVVEIKPKDTPKKIAAEKKPRTSGRKAPSPLPGAVLVKGPTEK